MAIAKVGADQVGVVDVGIEDVFTRLHLDLQFLNDVTFLNQVMGNFDAGDFRKGLGEHF